MKNTKTKHFSFVLITLMIVAMMLGALSVGATAPIDNNGTIVASSDGSEGEANKVPLPEVLVTDIKDTLSEGDPNLTFALNFAIKDMDKLTDDYLEALFNAYGDYYVDYVLTISGLKDKEVTFNANGDANGYLAGQYDAWSENWVTVPFEDVTIKNGDSLYIMEYAAKLMNQSGLRFTLAEIAEIVQNFDCGVYFTPEFLAANPNMKVTLELKVFTEDAEGNKIEDISVAKNVFRSVELPEVVVTDIKNSLTADDPDLTFALNFAIKDLDNLDEAYLEKVLSVYGDWYTDYVLTISGLTEESVKFNANGDANGYLAGQYDAWSENWVTVPFEDVTIKNGDSLYIMEYAAKLMNQSGLRFTLAEIATIVQNFDCGVYFTPEFLVANPNMKVTLELKVFTEDENGNKIEDISVAENVFSAEVLAELITALKGYTPENLPEGAELVVKLVSVGDTFVFDVTPMANGVEVKPIEAITFRLPVPASVTEAYAKVYHEGIPMGIYSIQGENNAKYVEISSVDFSEYVVEPVEAVAQIGDTKYATLADAIAAAQNDDTITLLANITLDATIKNTKKVTLDLNGKTITGIDNNTSGNFYLIDNRGTLTITDSSEEKTGKITLTANNDRGTSSSSVVVANNPGGKLVIESGTIEHFGGTYMAYAIDNLTNGKGTYAETVINGGTIKSTYRAVRQFLNGVEAQNILTINGGTITGTNKSIFFHDPSTNANSGKLTVSASAVINGDIYLFVTAGSTEWPVEVSIAANALQNDSKVVTGNVPSKYAVQNVNGTWGKVINAVASVNNVSYATLAEAIAATQNGDTITLIRDITASDIIVINKAITFDGNGKTLTSTADRAINVSGADGVTIKNLTIEASGERAINIIQNATNVTIDNVTATAKNYAVNVATSAANAKVTIKDSDLTGLSVVNVAAASAEVNITDTKITNKDATDVETYGAITLATDATNATVKVSSGEIITSDDSCKATVIAKGATVTGVDGVRYVVALINGGGFYSLEDAIDYAKTGDTITLLRDVSAAEIITIDKALTINGNGYTLTSTAARAINIDTTGKVVINNLTIKADERAINIINKVSTVELNQVTATAKNNAVMIATSAGAVQLTIKDSDLTGLAVVNVAGAGAKVEINDTYITNVDANSAEIYGAITVWSTAAGATVTVDGGSITVADDSLDAYVFPADATVEGVDNVGYIVAMVGDAGCTSLQSAINYIKSNGTIKIIRDIELSESVTVPAGKTITLDLNGKTLTGSIVLDVEATLTTASDSLTITTDAEGYEVVYLNGQYQVVEKKTESIEINGVTYSSLAAALVAAQQGDTITLLADNTEFADATLILTKGIQLNLNGYTLTAKYLVAFKGNHVIDSTNTEGQLIVAQDKVVLDRNNKHMAVYVVDETTGGRYYVFAEAYIATKYTENDNKDGFTVKYRPKFNKSYTGDVTDILANSVGKSGVQFIVRLSWDNGKQYQDFVYSAEMIKEALGSSNGMLTLEVSGVADYQDLKVTFILKSDCGVEYSKTAYTFNPVDNSSELD